MEGIQSDKQPKICIVGAGNMGYRHAQSLLSIFSTLYLVDINLQKALKVSELLKSECPSGPVSIKPLESIPNTNIDFAIVATDSSNRLLICKELITKTSPNLILIEKLLFDSLDKVEDWKIIGENTNSFVNTPRRAYPIYKMIENLTNKFSLQNVFVTGSNWNMASNAIHFLDLLYFLTNRGEAENLLINEANLRWFKSSKREGFYEANGFMEGNVGNTRFKFVSKDQPSDLIVRLEYETFIIEINETAKIAKVASEAPSFLTEYIPNTITLPYQSQLTSVYWREFREENKVKSLPPLNTSINQHLVLIEVFTSTFKKYNPSQILKIT